MEMKRGEQSNCRQFFEWKRAIQILLNMDQHPQHPRPVIFGGVFLHNKNHPQFLTVRGFVKHHSNGVKQPSMRSLMAPPTITGRKRMRLTFFAILFRRLYGRASAILVLRANPSRPFAHAPARKVRPTHRTLT
jgi:hypothetical protein